MEEKQYLYVVAGWEKVRTSYSVIASSEDEAIRKVNEGDYLDCDLGEIADEDIVDPTIVCKSEVSSCDDY